MVFVVLASFGHSCDISGVRSPRPLRNLSMACASCGSTNEGKFTWEIDMYIPGLKALNKPTVWVLPEIFVCLVFCKARFVVPEAELGLLTKGDAATAG